MSDREEAMKVIDSEAMSVRARLIRESNLPAEVIYADFSMSKGTVGAIVGTLNKVLGEDKARYMVCGWLFDATSQPMSSKEMSDGNWYALHKWMGFWKDESEIDGKWKTADGFEGELLSVYSASIRAAYGTSVDVQDMAGFDPMLLVNNIVGRMGGKVTTIIETEQDDPPDISKPVRVPKTLRNTRFGRHQLATEQERKILTELGYEPDEESIDF